MKYRLLRDSKINSAAKAGMTVYSIHGSDYGCAADDTRTTGVQHTAVTLSADGGYPFFTCAESDLEPIPAKYPDDEYTLSTCKLGQGADCCRYLALGANGWSCEKNGPHRETIVRRSSKGLMKAKGDNCAGLDSR
jgi:hypothetical protein